MSYSLKRKIYRMLAGVYVLLFRRRRLHGNAVDILIIHGNAIGRSRMQKLKDRLLTNGYSIKRIIIHSPSEILRKRKLFRLDSEAPLDYKFLEYYSGYLVKYYNPKIIICSLDSNPLAIFLKRQLNITGGKLVNLAHGITCATELFRVFHFHYYFVYGDMSVDSVKRQSIRYGETKLVPSGSYFIEEDFTLPINREMKKLLFFSSSSSHHLYGEALRESFLMLAKWANSQDRYHLYIKHHPIEDPSVIKSIFKDITNVTFLPSSMNIKDSMRDVSAVINGWSTASIEAALMNRPTVILNPLDVEDFPELQRYYGKNSRTPEELSENIAELFDNYDHYLEVNKSFVARHLYRSTDSIKYIADCIDSIVKGREDFETVPVTETIDYFTDMSKGSS